MKLKVFMRSPVLKKSCADIFISQGKPQMDTLESKKLILEETRINLVNDELVLIAEKSNTSIGGFEDLAKEEIKAVVASSKNPDYAKKLLEYMRSETAAGVFEKHGFKKVA